MARIESDIEKEIIADKKRGLSDREIGDKFGVTLRVIERIVTREFGLNISNPMTLPSLKAKSIACARRVKTLAPKNFDKERTTVWSFKSRGSWATHSGKYRGNWSPYIPRNIILRYSKDTDVVLDYFCGAGTTGVESKLLGRNFIGMDINPQAIDLAGDNVNFEVTLTTSGTNIDFTIGDARILDNIEDESVDLICAHPPYADIIQYTHDIDGDLSKYGIEKFLMEIEKTARESWRVLKPRHRCAILIGDMRKNKHVIPLGFRTIEKFLDAGFVLEELVIKRQHNCKTTGFWYNNSIKYNFLLLAHEYLAVFNKESGRKDSTEKPKQQAKAFEDIIIDIDRAQPLQSTTVWIFDENDWLNRTLSNLIKRYSSTDQYVLYNNGCGSVQNNNLAIDLSGKDIDDSLSFAKSSLSRDGIFAILCEDNRMGDGFIDAGAIRIEKHMRDEAGFNIKEIIIVSIQNKHIVTDKATLDITHKYILVYKKAY